MPLKLKLGLKPRYLSHVQHFCQATATRRMTEPFGVAKAHTAAFVQRHYGARLIAKLLKPCKLSHEFNGQKRATLKHHAMSFVPWQNIK